MQTRSPIGRMGYSDVLYLLIIITWCFLIFNSTVILKGRAEIRRHRIISPLFSIRWFQIEGYVWERHEQRCSLNVRLRGKKLRSRLHSTGIVVPVERMTAVDSVLQTLVAKWPGWTTDQGSRSSRGSQSLKTQLASRLAGTSNAARILG